MIKILEYFIALISIIILTILPFKNKKNRIVFLFLAISIFLFAALRGNGSGDYFTYKDYSTLIETHQDLFNNNFPMEFGYRLISYTVNWFDLNSQWVIIIMNAISSILIFLFVYKKSKFPFLSILILYPWFLTMDMHSTRTALAGAFGIWAIWYLIEEKYVKYIVFILLGSLFHKTVLILVVAIFIKLIRTKKTIFIAIFIYITSAFINLESLATITLNLIGLGNFASKLTRYLQDGEYGYPLNFIDPRIILILLIIVLGYFIYEILTPKKKEMFMIVVIGFIIMSIFRNNTFVSLRLSYYFYLILLIFIPDIIELAKKKIIFNGKKISWYHIFAGIYAIYSVGIIINSTVEYKMYIWP